MDAQISPANIQGKSPLDILAELGSELAVSINIETTLKKAINRIADYMQAEAASLFLVDGTSQQLECRACFGPVDITGLRLGLNHGIVGRTATEMACQLVKDVRVDPDFADSVDKNTGFQTRSIMCTPLSTAEGVIGVLQILNKRDGGLFCESDQATLRALAAPTALAVNNARLAQSLVEQEQLKKELFMARRLQRTLLPKRRKNFPFQGINLPARQVSGDFYDFFPLEDGRIGFIVGDVSGKGMNAALLMVRTATLLRWIGRTEASPGRWLAEVNNELCGSVANGMFVCAIAGYYDPAENHVTWANAGFPPALHIKEGEATYYPAAAPPLAIIEQQPLPDESLKLAGGSMYFYSDGVTEIKGDDGNMLETEGLERLIAQYGERAPKPRLGAIIWTLRRLRVVDDTTLVVLEQPS